MLISPLLGSQSTNIFPVGEGRDNWAKELIRSQIGVLALFLLRILLACCPALSTAGLGKLRSKAYCSFQIPELVKWYHSTSRRPISLAAEKSDGGLFQERTAKEPAV